MQTSLVCSDSSCAGKISEIKKWWDKLNETGPKYFPKPSKTILIVKDHQKLHYAKEIFEETGITIDTDGERHLGAVIGSPSFREKYVRKKVANWILDIDHCQR